MKILVTGGCGFIGHHLVEHLIKKTDWEVVVVDKLTYASNGYDRLRDINCFDDKRIKIFSADLMDLKISPGLHKEIGHIDYIAHLAAETHVDNSIENPYIFLETNVIGTYAVLEYAKQLSMLRMMNYFSTDEVHGPALNGIKHKETDACYSKNPYAASKAGAEQLCMAYQNCYSVPVFITRCHDEKTNILTKDGVKNINDVNVGDLVWTLKDNKKLKLEPIQEIFIKKDYKGEMIRFKSKKYDLLVTPEHRMLTRKKYREKEYTIKKAKDLLNIGDNEKHYLPLSGEWVGKKCKYVDISKYLRKDFCTKGINKRIKIEDLMAFIGWYVSKGSYLNGTISIKTTKHKKEIKNLIKILGFKSYGGKRSVEFYSITILDFLAQFGNESDNKTIPDWVLQYDKKYLMILFNALMKESGSKLREKPYIKYYTKSKELAEKVSELVIKLGYSAGIKEWIMFNAKKLKKSKSYYVYIRKAIGPLEKENISKTNYNGTVWCVRTSSGNFFIERNGDIACSGNTMNNYGERQHPEKFIPSTIKKVLAGETVIIHSNKDRTVSGSRFYIHARNTSDALLFLFNHGKKGEIYNIVGEKEVSNLELAHLIAKILGRPLFYEMVDFHSSRPGHDLRYALDGSKLAELGWTPPVGFEQSLEKTIQWYMENKEKWL